MHFSTLVTALVIQSTNNAEVPLSLVTIGGNYVCYIGLLEGTVTK